jgi:1,2-diacylglycerol 3-beta-galactosyltransferase
LLYADTGGGHRAAAQSVEQAIHQLYGDAYHTSIVNAIDALPYPYDQAEKVYPIAISHSRRGYELFWNVTNNRGSTVASRLFIETAGRLRACEFLRQHPADIYVSCHPIVNQAIPEALQHMARRTPVLGVVSDLATVHALFWSPKVSHFTVPSQAAYTRAVANGVSPARVTITGQPVLPDFGQRVSRGRLARTAEGSHPGRTAVLVMGGGDGMGTLVETVGALAQSDLPISIVAVCGRNESARAAIKVLRGAAPVTALGFCNNIPELMGAADVLVTKAGPGSICEGFIAGLPILLYDAVPGQEAGNIDWVTRSGAGKWCPSPELVVNQLRRWLAFPEQMRQAGRASLDQAQPDAALNIARVVAQTLDTHLNAAPSPLYRAPAVAQAQATGRR